MFVKKILFRLVTVISPDVEFTFAELGITFGSKFAEPLIGWMMENRFTHVNVLRAISVINQNQISAITRFSLIN